MATSVVTIARTLGAGGEIVGRAVADQLGFRYVDEEIITAAAEKENLDPATVADAERRRSLLDRLLESFGTSPALEATALGGMMADPSLYFPQGSSGERLPTSLPEHYRELIRQAIVETATAGRVVIHAHAAGRTLAGVDGVLRVLVTAPAAVRALRLSESRAASSRDAEKTIRESDRDRRDYFKRFHGLADEAPDDYDLVVNTHRLSPADAARVIVAAAGTDL